MVTELRQHVFPEFDRGLSPVIDSVFALEDVQQAHAKLEGGNHFGKTVLRVHGDVV